MNRQTGQFYKVDMRTGICLLALFVTVVAGAPSSRSMFVLEQRSDIPIGFAKGSPAPATKVVNLRLALKQNDMAGLEKALYDVSTPGSELYGQHLTKEEVNKSHPINYNFDGSLKIYFT